MLSLLSSDIRNAILSFITFSRKNNDDSFIDCHKYDEGDNKISSVSTAESFIENYLQRNYITHAAIREINNINHRINLISYLKSNLCLQLGKQRIYQILTKIW